MNSNKFINFLEFVAFLPFLLFFFIYEDIHERIIKIPFIKRRRDKKMEEEKREYEDDALVTLCTECHSSIHKDLATKTPLYNEVRDLIKDNLPLCPRCNGKGYLPEYAYNENGICFKCWGEGVTGYE